MLCPLVRYFLHESDGLSRFATTAVATQIMMIEDNTITATIASTAAFREDSILSGRSVLSARDDRHVNTSLKRCKFVVQINKTKKKKKTNRLPIVWL